MIERGFDKGIGIVAGGIMPAVSRVPFLKCSQSGASVITVPGNDGKETRAGHIERYTQEGRLK